MSLVAKISTVVVPLVGLTKVELLEELEEEELELLLDDGKAELEELELEDGTLDELEEDALELLEVLLEDEAEELELLGVLLEEELLATLELEDGKDEELLLDDSLECALEEVIEPDGSTERGALFSFSELLKALIEERASLELALITGIVQADKANAKRVATAKVLDLFIGILLYVF